MPQSTGDGLSEAARERLQQAVHDSPAAEVATATGKRPQTLPLSPFYDAENDAVIVTSPPAFAGKVDAVRENPKLSLLFYGAEEPFILYGRGTVHDDDLEDNAEYVQGLIQSEPESPKQSGFESSLSVLESRIGRFLFGWYALRVVVEIEPLWIESLEGTAGVFPPWPTHGVDRSEAEKYERIAFTVVDEDGWPTTRSVSDIEIYGEKALLDVPLAVKAGQPACLLAHWHTPGLGKLGQRLFRGRCRPADDGVVFEPGSSFSMRNETVLDRLKFIVDGKRRTRAYFAER